MLWQVRASLEDRPGTLAALAVSCGEQLVNILGLQIFPAADGRVVDELVLHTPGGWGPREVEQLCAGAGGLGVGERLAAREGDSRTGPLVEVERGGAGPVCGDGVEEPAQLLLEQLGLLHDHLSGAQVADRLVL